MADVIVSEPRHHDSVSAFEAGGLKMTAPAIEMVPNPVFSFPARPVTAAQNQRRPMSMLLTPNSAATALPHKRTASALPTFSFNANDNSGRLDVTPPRTPDGGSSEGFETPVRKGHRRGGSEFVGGDSRFGVNNAITTSPTKTDAQTLPSSHRRGAHAHRRSVAVSSHDLSQIMSAGERSPRLSSSLPTTPMDFPALDHAPQSMHEVDRLASKETNVPPPPAAAAAATAAAEAMSAEEEDTLTRPPSRPRVEFVEQVEIIPRPLSTISSETESSVSTILGHSVSGSINSVLTAGSPARPGSSSHTRGFSIGQASISSIAEPRPASRPRSSIEISKKLEKEGEWLRNGSPSADNEEALRDLTQTISAPAQHEPITFAEPTVAPRRLKRQSLGQAFGFDRRRSEPLISALTSSPETSRLSALSLQDVFTREASRTTATADQQHEKMTSGQKLKQWALTKLQRRHRDQKPPHNRRIAEPTRDEQRSEPSDHATMSEQPVVAGAEADNTDIDPAAFAETDLDAVFGGSDASEPTSTSFVAPRFGASPTRITFDQPSPSLSFDAVDNSQMLDLDAALGPLKAPQATGGHHRRQMHSDRSVPSFVHRRAESEPVLMAFSYNRTASSSQKSMEDVFEEDEEDQMLPASEEAGMGIAMVDADRSAFDPSDPESLRRRRVARDSDRPFTSYMAPTGMHLAVTPTATRPASLVDDIIAEESSPTEAVEIVEAHEEPRAASLEKCSDSSEASTLLAPSLLARGGEPENETELGSTTPETYDSSAFPSPDYIRRQGSFEASRVGTSASSLADTRTTSSCTTSEPHEVRMSVDDVPSLTSSRSTMMSTLHPDTSRRDDAEARRYEAIPRRQRRLDANGEAARRKHRASIVSLSQLVSGTFGSSKSKLNEESRPQTATNMLQPGGGGGSGSKKKEHRLKKLMFWRSKQNLRQAAMSAAAGTE